MIQQIILTALAATAFMVLAVIAFEAAYRAGLRSTPARTQESLATSISPAGRTGASGLDSKQEDGPWHD